MPRLNKQVAIVTGGGRGIGSEIARAFAAQGAAVAVVARTEAQVPDTVRGIEQQGGRALGIAALVALLETPEPWPTIRANDRAQQLRYSKHSDWTEGVARRILESA